MSILSKIGGAIKGMAWVGRCSAWLAIRTLKGRSSTDSEIRDLTGERRGAETEFACGGSRAAGHRRTLRRRVTEAAFLTIALMAGGLISGDAQAAPRPFYLTTLAVIHRHNPFPHFPNVSFYIDGIRIFRGGPVGNDEIEDLLPRPHLSAEPPNFIVYVTTIGDNPARLPTHLIVGSNCDGNEHVVLTNTREAITGNYLNYDRRSTLTYICRPIYQPTIITPAMMINAAIDDFMLHMGKYAGEIMGSQDGNSVFFEPKSDIDSRQHWQTTLTNLPKGFIQIKSKLTGKCLDLKNGGTTDGTYIVQNQCHNLGPNDNKDTQEWYLGDDYQLRNAKANKCFEVYNNYLHRATLGDCKPTNNNFPDTLTLSKYSKTNDATNSGTFTFEQSIIGPIKTGQTIGVKNGGTWNNTSLVASFTFNNNEAQHSWQMLANSDGSVTFYNGKTGKCAGIYGGVVSPGRSLVEYECNTTADTFAGQKWFLFQWKRGPNLTGTHPVVAVSALSLKGIDDNNRKTPITLYCITAPSLDLGTQLTLDRCSNNDGYSNGKLNYSVFFTD